MTFEQFEVVVAASTVLGLIGSGAVYLEANQEISGYRNSEAAHTIQIGDELIQARDVLIYHPAYTSTVLVGKVIVPQFHSAIYPTPNTSKMLIQEAEQDIMATQVSPQDEIIEPLEIAKNQLPNEEIATTYHGQEADSSTFASERQNIELGYQRFFAKVPRSFLSTFQNYKEAQNRENWAVLSGVLFGTLAAIAGGIFGGVFILDKRLR